jgi:hypothetical protein
MLQAKCQISKYQFNKSFVSHDIQSSLQSSKLEEVFRPCSHYKKVFVGETLEQCFSTETPY